MQQGPTETWLDFYIKMRKGLNTQDRNKLDEEFFGNKNDWKYRTSTNLIRAGEPSTFPDFNKPFWEVKPDVGSNWRRDYHLPDDAAWNVMPSLFAAGRDTRLLSGDNVKTVQHNIADRLPLYLDEYRREYVKKLLDPVWVSKYPSLAKDNAQFIAEHAKRIAGESGHVRLHNAVYDDNPEVTQYLKDLNFEEKWKRLPTAVRQVLNMRKDLYDDLKPEIKDIIHPPTPPREPFKPQPVEWEQSRTKNLETDPEAEAALIQRIQQLQSGQMAPDLRAGMIDPSIAGDLFQRSAVNDQNIAVGKERMAARKEATPWFGRLFAPERASGIMMDPRLNLPGFTEQNIQRPQLGKNDPVVKQINEQNAIVKRGTTPSKKESAAQKKRALLDLFFMEDDLKSKTRRGGMSSIVAAILAQNEMNKKRVR